MADADTRDKRAAVLLYGGLPSRLFPNPDGSIAGEPDRVFIGTFYPGILPSGAVPDAGTDTVVLMIRRRM